MAQFLVDSNSNDRLHMIVPEIIDVNVGDEIYSTNGKLIGQVKSIQDIFMTYAFNEIIQISVDGFELFGFPERMALAYAEGFKEWDDFFEKFYPIIDESKDHCFSGQLVHWSDRNYSRQTIDKYIPEIKNHTKDSVVLRLNFMSTWCRDQATICKNMAKRGDKNKRIYEAKDTAYQDINGQINQLILDIKNNEVELTK